jgi:glutamate racemase
MTQDTSPTAPADATAPIGIFDSGVGGLAVLSELRRLLPGEDIVYYADTAYFPYGPRSSAEIRERAEAITRELLSRGAKIIVVACNTATSAAIAHLRDAFDVPFVGMEPALKPAAEKTLSGKVALLATPGTARGEKLAALIDRYGAEVAVQTIEAPGLAACVETGAIDAPETLALIRRYLEPVQRSGADVVALGCTHYAFLRPIIERELGDGVLVIEPSEAVARQTARVLASKQLRNPRTDGSGVVYLCSGDEQAFAAIREQLIGGAVALENAASD